ncbi:hypothetical protein MUK42_33788 [Musa troglodytarum]|uniref:Uncharacterized protein n=1 Tax=Musa troglodytarum TaxID=320322 RepID=A0A9E7HEQ8_9LILI|nr:hypothetical protein MUK42_33788 [Musa troglodytarum]
MIWVMGMQRRFDLACFLVRGMHPESVLTQQAVVIVMERIVKYVLASYAFQLFEYWFARLRGVCDQENYANILLASSCRCYQSSFPYHEPSTAGIDSQITCHFFVGARVSRMAFLENGASCSRFHIFRGGNRVPCLNFQVCWQSSNVPCAVHLVGIRDAIENGGAASSLANRTKAHRPVSIFLSRFK